MNSAARRHTIYRLGICAFKVVLFIIISDHPKVKAFVNHGGLLGVLEAGWYGLPMVGIPLFGNHFDNMERVVAKGMGLKLEVSSLTHYDLYEAVTRVIKEPRYVQNAVK